MLANHLETAETEVDPLHGPEIVLVQPPLRRLKIISIQLDPDRPILAVVTSKIQPRILASPIHIRHLVL
jgi:hypothetical protein